MVGVSLLILWLWHIKGVIHRTWLFITHHYGSSTCHNNTICARSSAKYIASEPSIYYIHTPRDYYAIATAAKAEFMIIYLIVWVCMFVFLVLTMPRHICTDSRSNIFYSRDSPRTTPSRNMWDSWLSCVRFLFSFGKYSLSSRISR